ncbi:hydrophobic surface binding protein [Mycena rebaudengoi]|nr:hydrophobic surface binding protein [Mycena rebaudengoi]
MVLLFGFQVLVSVLLLTTSLATPLKRTVAQVEDDIVGIITQAAMLDATLNDVPTTGPVTGVGASSILSAFAALETTVNQTVADMKATGPLSEADASTIIRLVVDIEPTMLDALKQVIVKQPNLGAISRGGLLEPIHQHLLGFLYSFTAFTQVLFAVVPADLQPKLMGLTDVGTALAAAISRYSF